jgi:hypothetical protein
MKAEAEVLAVRHTTFILQEQHVVEVEKGGEQREEWGDVSNGVEALIEALNDVGDKVGVRDRGTDLNEGVVLGLLAVEVIADREDPLLVVAEFYSEINLAGLLVVIEEAMDGRPDRVRSGDGLQEHKSLEHIFSGTISSSFISIPANM